MKNLKTVNLPAHINVALKLYATRNNESVQNALTRVVNDLLVRTGDIKSREIGK